MSLRAGPPRLVLDHVALTCRMLGEGRAHVRDCLDIDMPAGGAHAAMGTHNLLGALGAAEYLEAIAVDPRAQDPMRARWFELDRFDAEPTIGTWVLGTADIERSLAVLSRRVPTVQLGRIVPMTRGGLSWLISVPDDGSLPLDGAFPTLIQWTGGSPHPAGRMPDIGCRLSSLSVRHPQGALIAAALDGLLLDDRIRVTQGTGRGIRARLMTGDGMRTLF